jgi:hypothetical protein
MLNKSSLLLVVCALGLAACQTTEQASYSNTSNVQAENSRTGANADPLKGDSDEYICTLGINRDPLGWGTDEYAKEAQRRGLTTEQCLNIITSPPRQYDEAELNQIFWKTRREECTGKAMRRTNISREVAVSKCDCVMAFYYNHFSEREKTILRKMSQPKFRDADVPQNEMLSLMEKLAEKGEIVSLECGVPLGSDG